MGTGQNRRHPGHNYGSIEVQHGGEVDDRENPIVPHEHAYQVARVDPFQRLGREIELAGGISSASPMRSTCRLVTDPYALTTR